MYISNSYPYGLFLLWSDHFIHSLEIVQPAEILRMVTHFPEN